MRAALKRSSAVRTTCSAPNGTTNWYWTNPRGPYTRFQSRTPSSGKKNGLMPSTWRRRRARRLAEPHLVEGLDAQQVDEAVRQPRRRTEQCARRVLPAPSRVRRSADVVERGVVAAGQHRAAEVTDRWRGSRSTRPSSGSRDRRRACAPCSRRRRWCVRCRTRCATSRPVAACSVASVMTPVRPMPPLVAQNASASASGSSVRAPLRRGDDPHPLDVVGERAVAELAVDVGGDRAADRDVARARDDHREPTERQQYAQQRVETHAALDGDGALVDVDREDRVEVAARQTSPPAFCAASPYERPEPARDDTARTRRGDLGDDVVEIVGPAHGRERGRGAPPTRAAVPGRAGVGAGHVRHPRTASAKKTAQSTPITSRTRSASTRSSGAPPRPCSSSSA